VITVDSLFVDFAADLYIIFQDGDLNACFAGCGIIFVEASLSGSADHGELGVRALCGDVSYLVVGASGLTSSRGHRAERSAGVARAMDSILLSKAAVITNVHVDTGCSHGAVADLPVAGVRIFESIAL